MSSKILLPLIRIESMSSLEIAELTGLERDNLYGHVYAIVFDGGLIKIGKSRSPLQRIKYLSDLIGNSRKVIGSYVSEYHFKYWETEAALLNKFSNMPNEFCSNVSIEEINNYLVGLTISAESEFDKKERIKLNAERIELCSKLIFDRFNPEISRLTDSLCFIDEIIDNYLKDNFEYCKDSEMFIISSFIGIKESSIGYDVYFYPEINMEIVTSHDSLYAAIRFIINNYAKTKI